jgi:hypothetical protein
MDDATVMCSCLPRALWFQHKRWQGTEYMKVRQLEPTAVVGLCVTCYITMLECGRVSSTRPCGAVARYRAMIAMIVRRKLPSLWHGYVTFLG